MAQIRVLKDYNKESIYPQTLTSAIFNEENKSLDNLLASKVDLENVYFKNEIDNMISALATLDIRVVDTLPTTEISTKSLYLLKVNGETNNNYEEYVYTNGKWEMIGTTKIDLSEYYSKAEVDAMFANVNGYVATASTTDIGGILYGEGDK